MSSTGQCFDIDSFTRKSLLEFERRQQAFAKKHKISSNNIDFLLDPHLLKAFDVRCSERGAAGNGALMRLAPVPLFFYRHPSVAVEFSGTSGVITHGDTKAYDSCRYYGALIVAALQGEMKEELLDDEFYFNHKSWFNNKSLTSEVMKVAQGSYKKIGGYHDGIRGSGDIVSALEAALWAFCYDGNSFEKGVLDAVNLGDDTDTTAAIYGQLAGAYYGYENLPTKWTSQIHARNFIACLSKWIVYEGDLWRSKHLIRNQPVSTHRSRSIIPAKPMKKSNKISNNRLEYVHGSTARRAKSDMSLRFRATPRLYGYPYGLRPSIYSFENTAYNMWMPYSYERLLGYGSSYMLRPHYDDMIFHSGIYNRNINDDNNNSFWERRFTAHRRFSIPAKLPTKRPPPPLFLPTHHHYRMARRFPRYYYDLF
ncbi:unnamed protein product [Rotaria sp. Silwood2]|nr:unnamed protein product [Rotaria sp. Silwood2]